MTKPDASRGSILILALWILTLLTVFSVSVGFAARQKATLLTRIDSIEQLFDIASAGVQKIGSVLRQDESNSMESTLGVWVNNTSAFSEIPVGDGFFSLETPVYDDATGKIVTRTGAVDEESKINVNTADAQTLGRLFKGALDISEDQAQSIAYAIVDWRDADSFYGHPNYGSEDPDYRDLRLPYEGKDAPFDVLDELLLVRGINQAIFDRIKPFVTVYGTGTVNINTASRPVLGALGLSSQVIDSIMVYRAGPDKELGNGDANIFTDSGKIVEELELVVPVGGIDAPAIEALADQNKLGVGSNYFRVEVKAQTQAKGEEMRLEAVLMHSGKTVYMRTITGQNGE